MLYHFVRFNSCIVGSSDSECDQDYWIPYQLYNCDRQSLEFGMDITENVVNAAQTLLKNQFVISGFQNTTLATYLNFIPISPSEPSIQILHTGIYMYIRQRYMHVYIYMTYNILPLIHKKPPNSQMLTLLHSYVHQHSPKRSI